MHPKRTIFRDLRDDVKLSIRFWAKVATGETDTCWPWTAYRGKPLRGLGYGKLGINGRIHYAHRIAWELTHGPIPDLMRVLHRCDNPPCCNPAHLFLGTQGENVQDMHDKGRHGPKVVRPIPPGHTNGEAHHSAKLTASDVLAIREAASAGTDLQTLAARYGVTKQSIWAIVHRKKWKHV